VTPRLAAWVALGAVAGALLRWAASAGAPRVVGVPAATLGVNLVGSFVLGVIAGWSGPDGRVSAETRAAVGTGFCGALTTMSTFAVETLAEAPLRAAANVGANVGGSLLAAAAGLWVGRALRGPG
jgi:CrcB protein